MYFVNVYVCIGRCIIMKYYYELLFFIFIKIYVYEGNILKY